MNQRTAIESAVSESLRAVNETGVSTTLTDFAEEHWSPYTANAADYTDTHADLGQAFEIIRSQHQIIQASMGELASRRIVQTMAEQLDANGSLLRQPPYDHDTIDRETSASSPSPTLQKLLHIQNSYFSSAYDEVFKKAREGRMPYAAIVEVGSEVNQVYRWLEHDWAQSARTPHARNTHYARLRGGLPPMKAASLQEAVKGPFRRNLLVAAAALIGRGVAHDRSGSPAPKADFIGEELEEVSRLSSTVWAVSFPILKQTSDLLRLYSEWERGEISASEFHRQTSDKRFAGESAFYHKSLKDGPAAKPGHCSADVAFTDIDAFPVAPMDLLGRFGLELSQHIRPSLTHLLFGGMWEIGKGTTLRHWPDSPGQTESTAE